MKTEFVEDVGVFDSLSVFLRDDKKYREIFCELYDISKEDLQKLLKDGDLYDWVEENVCMSDTGIIEDIFDRLGQREPCIFYYVKFDDHNDGIRVEKWKILQEVISDISEKILVANWYNKEQLEEVTGNEFSDEEYKELVRRWNKYGPYDEVNEIVREFVRDCKGRIS